MKVVRLEIPSGEPGTDATVRIIRQLIESGKRSLKIRYFAEWILNLYNVTARDRIGEIAAIHDWAKKNIRYVQDPYRVEYVQTPERLLVTRTGDCDDFTALVGALVEAIGYPVDIKVVAKPGRKEFHHVYPVARIGTESVGLDASMPVPLGYESPQISRSKTYRSELNMLDVFSNVGLGAAPGDTDIERTNGAPEGGGAVVITGGNGIRQIPKFVNGVATFLPGTYYVVMPGKPVRGWYVRRLFDRGFFVPLKGAKLTMVDFANGISEVNAIATQVPTGNGGPVIYPPPPEDQIVLPTEGDAPGGVVGPGGVRPDRLMPPQLPTGGGVVRDGILYLKLGDWWSGHDAQKRMQEGTIRPAHAGLMLVYRPNPTLVANGAGGTVVAVLRTVNGNGAGVVEPTGPGVDRVTVPEFDIYGQPTTPQIVVTTPGAPAAGIDTKTMLMIGGGLVVLMLLMKK
jgi:hypothetical protein